MNIFSDVDSRKIYGAAYRGFQNWGGYDFDVVIGEGDAAPVASGSRPWGTVAMKNVHESDFGDWSINEKDENFLDEDAFVEACMAAFGNIEVDN